MDPKITLIENQHACMWYYPDSGIIHHRILQPISGEIFHNLLMTGLSTLKEHSAQKWLSDDRHNSFLSAEDSAWSQDYWLPLAVRSGWKHWALLPPEKARGQVNMERIVDHIVKRHRLNVKLFLYPDMAWEWLIRQGDDITPKN